MTVPTISKYERMLMAMPSDFRKLATWSWTDLRPALYKHAIECGANADLAAVIASRLAKLVVQQVYGDIRRAREIPTVAPPT